MSRTRLRRLVRTIVTASLLLCAVVVLSVQRLGAAAPPASDLDAATTDAGTPVDAVHFARGSCVAFAPTTGDRHLTVFLDAGHGGPDPGGQGTTSTGSRVDERQLTLPVTLDAARLLRGEGFRVVLSRTNASSVVRLGPTDLSGGLLSVTGAHRDTAARALCADLSGAAALVSVHFNVGSSPSNAGTLTTYDAVRPFAKQNLTLARMLQTDMVQALRAQPGWHVPDDGVVDDSTVGNALTAAGAAYGHLLVLGPAKAGYFSTPSTMPGALIEPLFLTDPFEGSIAVSPAGQQIMAAAIAKGVTDYLSREPPLR